MAFKLTDKQQRANELLASDATHCMLYGGSRSGKTFVLVRAVVVRALKVKSRHAMLRFRFNHIKASIVYDTLPKVMELCFPGVAQHCKLNKEDWFYTLPNGSEIWFGGLDDKERTEKILGQEYSTILMNECSQIPWASRNMAITRLAQKTDLKLKAYYDCNPSSMAHWTYRLFVENRSPDTREPLSNPRNYAAMVMNPKDNAVNLDQQYLDELGAMSERMRRRFLLGQFQDATESALWTIELIEQQRWDKELPEFVRIVVAVDPSGCEGKEDERSDEVGIVVCGLSELGHGFVLEDLSGKHGPKDWAEIAVNAYERWKANRIVAEVNYGGAMVKQVLDAKAKGQIRFHEVRATRGKHVRAEPVSVLFEQQKVWVYGHMPELEDQLCSMTTSGYAGSKSPDRLDAMVWGLTDLFPAISAANSQTDSVHKSSPKITLGHSKMKRNNR